MATYLLIATTAMQYAIDRNSPLGLGAEYAAVEMTPQTLMEEVPSVHAASSYLKDCPGNLP